jgi:hypothetical protein
MSAFKQTGTPVALRALINGFSDGGISMSRIHAHLHLAAIAAFVVACGGADTEPDITCSRSSS